MPIISIQEVWRRKEEKVNCFIQPGLLPTGGSMLIAGNPGIGKSYLALETAFEIATGRRWLGLFPTKPTKVAYLELERGTAIARARVRRKDWKAEYADVGDNLGYYDEKRLRIDTPSGAKEMEQNIANFGAKVIIIDSFAVTLGNESEYENLKLALGNYKTMARKLGIAFIFVHHLIKRGLFQNKAGDFVNPPIRMDDIRGAKLLEYDIDTVVGLDRGRGDMRILMVLKHSYCPYRIENNPINFHYRPDTPIPYQASGKISKLLEYIDYTGPVSVTQLEEFGSNSEDRLSRTRVTEIIDSLKRMGLIIKSDGGGRGNETMIEVRRWAD